jgi:WD40 repeat protein
VGLAALALDESTPAEANAGLVSTLTAGRQFHELHHGDSTVESVQLGPNGLALTADGGDVELSDVSNISLPRGRVPLGSSGGPAVVATALAEDGKIAVVARAQQAGAPNPNTYEIWDTSDPEHPQVAGNAGSCAPDAVAVNSVSSLVLAGCFDGSATLWSITDRAHPQRVADLATSGGPAVHAVAISASGNRAVVGSDAGLAIWDLAGNGKPVQDHDSYRPTAPTMNGPAVPVYSVGIDRKGSTIIFGSNGGGAQVVQTRSSRAGNPPPQELNVQGQNGGVVEVAASADGSTLLTAGQNAVIVWKNDTGGVFTPRAIMRNHAEAVSTVAVSPDGRTALSGGLDGRAVLSNLAVDYKYSLSYKRKSFTNRPDAVACSRSVSTCVVTTDAGEAIVWDVTDPAAPQRMAALTAVPVSGGAVAFADSHAVVAAGGKDGTITLLDVSDPAHPLQLGTAAAVAAGVTAVAFKPGADTLAVGSSDGVVTLFSVDAAFGLHRLNSIDEHHGAVRSLSFPRSGPVLASGYGDGAVMLLPAGSSTPLLRLSGGVRSVAMSTESDPLLAAADGAPNLVYWQPGDSANGVIPYGGHTGVVNSAGYNDTGTMAVTASADATAIVWSMVDPADPRPMVAMTGHTDAVTSAAFANRGSTVVTVGADHQLITWDISRLAAIAADPRASACHAAGRAFTASEWQAQGIPAQFPYVNSCP